MSDNAPLQRVTRSNRCPICGHDHWCGISADGMFAVCMRVDSERKAKNGGHVHRVDGSPIRASNLVKVDPPKMSRVDAMLLERRFAADITSERRISLAVKLGVSPLTLSSFGLGWNAEQNAYTFPMYDADKKVIGFRTRHADGAKRCVTGSRLGFMASTAGTLSTGWLLVCEGESDAAAAVDLGFAAIARPGCKTCREVIARFIDNERPEAVAIIADADEDGQKGAHDLAQVVGRRHRTTVITLPDVKDLREWKNVGGHSHHELLSIIESPPDRRVGGSA